MFRIMHQQRIFQIQPERARIQIIAGHQRILVIYPHALQMIGIVFIFPQMHLQLLLAYGFLMRFQEAAQIHFIQVRQCTDGFETLFRRNVKVICDFIADHNIHLYAAFQGAVDFAGNRQREIEIRGADHNPVLCMRDQLAYHAVQRIIFSDTHQRRDIQRAGGFFLRCRERIVCFFQAGAESTDFATDMAGGR